MSQYQIDIADMQCWVFRMAQRKWNISANDCVAIFKQHDVLGFIARCYDILHLSSYECALEDVEEMLRNRGVTVRRRFKTECFCIMGATLKFPLSIFQNVNREKTSDEAFI